jgi:hypothetical protein
MQNKPNFSKPKMHATLCGKKDYEKRPCGWSFKNKPKQSQFPSFPLPIVWHRQLSPEVEDCGSRLGFSEWLLPVDVVFV